MNLVGYLVDNNVLSRLTRAQRASTFFRDNCSLRTEVLHEASGFPDLAELRWLEYPVSAGVLSRVRDVMATVPPGDFKLVDLYRNLGNADPILIASALEAKEAAGASLFAVDWRIVTDDAAVAAKARAFGVATLNYNEFVCLLPLGHSDWAAALPRHAAGARPRHQDSLTSAPLPVPLASKPSESAHCEMQSEAE